MIYHTGICTNFVAVGPAARAAGQPYQYVYGMAKRNYASQKPRISVQGRFVYGNKLKLEVCLDCIVGKYGKAGSQDTQLLATPLIGYRSWEISNNQLVSWHNNRFPWLPGKTTATCDRGHEVPGKRCGCGLYALSSINDRHHYTGDVFGQVELWGRYRGSDQGEQHTRAQYGRPIALLCDNWTRADAIHRVAALYRVPVTHSMKMLRSVDWGALAELEGGVLDAHRHGESPWRGDAEAPGSGAGGDAGPAGRGAGGGAWAGGRAACRVAAERADSLTELKQLGKLGTISWSNVQEIFSFDDE
jgi:hypothetical protein